MDLESLKQEILEIIRRNILPLLLLLVGFVLVVYGLISYISSNNTSKQLEFENTQDQKPTFVKKIVVDIEGGVQKPGAYNLNDGDRIKDLLVLSGGLSSDADRNYFEKNINLAAKLNDGEKIYIQRQGESSIGVANAAAATQNVSGLLNINTASLKDLDALPGIGVVTAQKIVDGRPFSNINELLSRKIVTSKVFDEIKTKISSN